MMPCSSRARGACRKTSVGRAAGAGGQRKRGVQYWPPQPLVPQALKGLFCPSLCLHVSLALASVPLLREELRGHCSVLQAPSTPMECWRNCKGIGHLLCAPGRTLSASDDLHCDSFGARCLRGTCCLEAVYQPKRIPGPFRA